jgi:uncharacterized protein YndB with AHSA1/START domain
MTNMTNKNQTQIIAEKGKQELFIIREFEAPRDMVFKVFSDPELLVQWLGPKNLTMKIDKLDNRSGGEWRFIHTDAKGQEYGFRGVTHEVAAPERMIRTFEFEGLPERGHVSLEFLTLETLAGERTKATIQAVFKSVADRDGLVQSGMEKGVVEGHERIDELLTKLKQ